MKKWIIGFSTVVLAACAQNGTGGTSQQNFATTCHTSVLTGAQTENLTVSDAATDSVTSGAQDPYLAEKVVLAKSESQLRTFDVEVVPKGTEFSVTLRESCDLGGEISSSINSQKDLAMVATPSGVRSYSWTLNRELSFSDLKGLADSDACVVGISESVQAQATTAALLTQLTDPLVSQQGHLSQLGAAKAYEILNRLPVIGRPVTIAVIDTGIDMNHADLKNILWRNPGEIAANGIDDDGNGYVDDVYGYDFATNSGSPQYAGTWSGDQHGTHVSGLAAAQGGNGLGGSGVIGTNARIMMLNVFGPHTGANVSDTANAIRYAADNGANVINLSIGGSGQSAAYESALAYAISKGVFIVAAAGNDGKELSTSFFEAPGSYAKKFGGMIAVASVDSSTNALSTFSNYGQDYVTLAAPGSENSRTRYGLLSTWPGGAYARIQGTSMSSPVTAGAAAFAIVMMRQRGYAPSPATVEALLETSAQSVTALNTAVSHGRILSLSGLAQFINKTYIANGSLAAATDPGVPGLVSGCN